MPILAFMVAVAAAVAFGYESIKTRSLTAFGLFLLTVALILEFVIRSGTLVTIR